jgi:hypothetical protein
MAGKTDLEFSLRILQPGINLIIPEQGRNNLGNQGKISLWFR